MEHAELADKTSIRSNRSVVAFEFGGPSTGGGGGKRRKGSKKLDRKRANENQTMANSEQKGKAGKRVQQWPPFETVVHETVEQTDDALFQNDSILTTFAFFKVKISF